LGVSARPWDSPNIDDEPDLRASQQIHERGDRPCRMSDGEERMRPGHCANTLAAVLS